MLYAADPAMKRHRPQKQKPEGWKDFSPSGNPVIADGRTCRYCPQRTGTGMTHKAPAASGKPNQEWRLLDEMIGDKSCAKVMLHTASDAMEKYGTPKRNHRRRKDIPMNHTRGIRGAAYRAA